MLLSPRYTFAVSLFRLLSALNSCKHYPRYLKNKLDVEKSALKLWKRFITGLYDQIIQGRFKRSGIGFMPPLNKVEIYKLKKILKPSEHIFIEAIEGENLTGVSL